jgi:hypothetical protein
VPRLQRVDERPLPSDALEQHRFGITIQSIHYYPTSDGVCCAILLKTSFDLPMVNLVRKETCYIMVVSIDNNVGSRSGKSEDEG